MSVFADFGRMEERGWTDPSIASAYGDHFAEPTSQAVPHVLAALDVGPGTALLDVCCGPGRLSQAAAEAGASVTGLDFSPAMLEQARARCPGATFIQGDAQAMPFADASFDRVACLLGVPHIPDTVAALKEMRRVLRPGGKVAVLDWCGPDKSPTFGFVLSTLKTHGDPAAITSQPPGPAMFRFADRATAEPLFAEAGFKDVGIDILDTTVSFADATGLFEMFRRGTVRVAMMMEATPPDTLKRVAAAMADGFAEFARPGGQGLSAPLRSALATARVD